MLYVQISGKTDSNSKILLLLDSPLVEKFYRLYNITLLPIKAENYSNICKNKKKEIFRHIAVYLCLIYSFRLHLA